ncbi:MAG TPA: glycine cleavage system aminomethyltransferase GcvT [Saprospiraceae bacterium]|nr:glycine cleavage system aminomethyltransferase GcvT [Saprospiraceae bacterium]HPG07576.1 glycine cleavage system aminomethyltransferase GcvT [Saprospiraceae bacterium]HQU52814.1 glycine cleavage system aminomethyltransferase GcvT [Saprospiraceae bacterium]HRV86060.1 glycine cleavage system aminomethyltransferase GcvT [Saprospiraceae bacterium]
MKTTPLTDLHQALGAKMAPFAGYLMPISYSGIQEEHKAVRERAGLFDVSHMGEFIVKGKQALDLIQYITSNDVSKLAIGQAQYSCMPNSHGGIIDDLLVYRLDEDQCSEGEQAFMLVVNASNIDKDWDNIQQYAGQFDTRIVNISDQSALLALQGPKAAEILQQLTDVDLSQLKYYHFAKGSVAGVGNVIVSATGYTGAGGYELYFNNHHAVQLWDAIMEAGKSAGVMPVGLGARDTLRLEMGYCLYGNDIDDTTSPLEAGLGWITKLKKGPFVGKEKIEFLKQQGISRKLVGFTVQDRRVPRHDYLLFSATGQEIGRVTSGTMSPTLGIPIGMGYVPADLAKPGTAIQVQAGSKFLAAEVTGLPFLTD